MHRRTLFKGLYGLSLTLAIARPAGAASPPVFAPNGVAISGVDPVAYFIDAKPVPGVADLRFDWQGAAWYFADIAHRDTFAAAPDSYAPQYGGYCALHLAEGDIATTEPEAWTIHNGRLYLNYSLAARDEWRKDIESYIRAAARYWPAILNG